MSNASLSSQKKFNPIKGTSYSSTSVSNMIFDSSGDSSKMYANEALKYVKLEESMTYDKKNGMSAYAILDGFILPESLNDVSIDFSYATLSNADSYGKYFAVGDQQKSYWKSEPLTKNLNHNYIGNSFIRIVREIIEVPGQKIPKPCLYITNINPDIQLMGFKITIRDIPKVNSFPNSSTFISLKTDDLNNVQKPYTFEEGITLNHNLPIPMDQIVFNVIDARKTKENETIKTYPGLRIIKSEDPGAPQTVLDGFMSISGLTPNPGEFKLKFNATLEQIKLIPDALLVNVSGAAVTIIFTDASPKTSKSECKILRENKNIPEVKLADTTMQIPWTFYWDKDTGKAISGKVFNVTGSTIENGTENRRMKFRQNIGNLIPNIKPDGTKFINDGGVLFVSKPLLPGIAGQGWGSGLANPDDVSEIRLAFHNSSAALGKYSIQPFAIYAQAPLYEDQIDLHLGDIRFDFEQNQSTYSANLKLSVNWKK